jgi:pimeloyl-ACP methyl ester carboxylesterase
MSSARGPSRSSPPTATRGPCCRTEQARVESLAKDGSEIRDRVYGSGEPAANQRKDWSIANFGADVAAAVKESGHQRVVLVGSSMGGPVALEAARRLPGQVVGIVGEHFFTERTDPVLKKWIVDDVSAAPPEVAIPAIIALMAMDYGPSLAELDLPIIAVNSTGSPTDEAGIRAVEPRFKVVNLQAVGHFPMLEDPQTFNRVLARIVAEWVALEPQRNPLSPVPGTR